MRPCGVLDLDVVGLRSAEHLEPVPDLGQDALHGDPCTFLGNIVLGIRSELVLQRILEDDIRNRRMRRVKWSESYIGLCSPSKHKLLGAAHHVFCRHLVVECRDGVLVRWDLQNGPSRLLVGVWLRDGWKKRHLRRERVAFLS